MVSWTLKWEARSSMSSINRHQIDKYGFQVLLVDPVDLNMMHRYLNGYITEQISVFLNWLMKSLILSLLKMIKRRLYWSIDDVLTILFNKTSVYNYFSS